MEMTHYYATLSLIFLFYLFTIYLLYRVILYNGIKRNRSIVSEDFPDRRAPLMIAAGSSLTIGTFILLDSILAFITSNLSEDFSWLRALGLSSMIFIIHAIVIIISYSISRVILHNALSIKSRVALSTIWVIVSSIIYLLLLNAYNYFLNVQSYEIF